MISSQVNSLKRERIRRKDEEKEKVKIKDALSTSIVAHEQFLT